MPWTLSSSSSSSSSSASPCPILKQQKKIDTPHRTSYQLIQEQRKLNRDSGAFDDRKDILKSIEDLASPRPILKQQKKIDTPRRRILSRPIEEQVKVESGSGGFHDRNSLLKSIKSCGRQKQLWKAKSIHAYVVEKNLLATDVYIATALLHTYCKCGALHEAREVFKELRVRNVVTWTALIVGYAHHGLHESALECFQQMQDDGVCPDAVTYACILTTCSILGALDIGEAIDAEIRKQELLQGDVVLGNALVNMYAKCGEFAKAEEVFRQLPVRNVACWNALLAAYTQHDHAHETLKCFQKLQDEGVCPNAVTYICALKACSVLGCLEIGQYIDAEARKQGLLQKDIALTTTLVDMYAKCLAPGKSREVFEQLHLRDIVCWNVLISGYVQNELVHEALKGFKQMQDEGVCPDVVTYASVLKGCGIVDYLKFGEEIDASMRKQGIFQKDLMLGNTLIDMYAKCGELEKAREVFEQLPLRDVVSWNTLITGYVQQGLGDEALKCFRQMQDEGITPNSVTYIGSLKACGIVKSLEIGEDIDIEVRKRGLLQTDIVLSTTLVDMYSKCGALEKAQEIFELLQNRDIVAWNSLIAGCIQHRRTDDALKYFTQMQDEGVCPDVVTYAYILKVCGIAGSLEIGEDIHSRVRQQGLLCKDVALGNSLVDMYAKCGIFEKAREVFEQIPVQDVVAWTALISGYAQHGLYDEAMQCFQKMQDEGIRPDAVTYICLLKACGSVGSLEMGNDIAAQCRKEGLLHDNFVMGNTLMDMYARCGALDNAQEVFKQLSMRDVVSWNGLITAYAQIGQGNAALNLFKEMLAESIVPNLGTFTGLLAACSHGGLLNEGGKLFDAMCLISRFSPTLEHYTCMINLFGRAGHFDKAIALLDKVPQSDHLSLLVAILGACHKWMNLKLGKWVFEQSLKLDVKCASAYVFMGNIYAAESMQTGVGSLQ